MIGRPLSPVSFAGARRRGRRRGLVVGMAAGAAMANRGSSQEPEPAYEQPVATPSGSNDMVAQLQQLAQLKEQGILTEEEFAAQKAKILGQ